MRKKIYVSIHEHNLNKQFRVSEKSFQNCVCWKYKLNVKDMIKREQNDIV